MSSQADSMATAIAPTSLKQANASMAAASADHVRARFATMHTSARAMNTAAAAALHSVQVRACARMCCVCVLSTLTRLSPSTPHRRRGAQSTTETLRSAKDVLLEVAAAADEAAAAESVFGTSK